MVGISQGKKATAILTPCNAVERHFNADSRCLGGLQTLQALYITCSTVKTIEQYTFVTGRASSSADPVRWTLEGGKATAGAAGSTATIEWTMLSDMSTADYPTPTESKKQLPWFSLATWGGNPLAPAPNPAPVPVADYTKVVLGSAVAHFSSIWPYFDSTCSLPRSFSTVSLPAKLYLPPTTKSSS